MITKTFYRLLPNQIPAFWEAIKFACDKTDRLDPEIMPQYYAELLQALLSNKAQCYVVMDANRILVGIGITRIVVNKVTMKKELVIQNGYSMQRLSDEEILHVKDIVLRLAKKEGCSSIGFTSANPRVWEIARIMGIPEKHRYFSVNIE